MALACRDDPCGNSVLCGCVQGATDFVVSDGYSVGLLGARCGFMEPWPAPVPQVASFSDGLMRRLESTVVDTGPVRSQIEQDVNGDGVYGSTTSITADFLAREAPLWVVISCGLRNRYGHPRQQILEELQAARVRTFRTDTEGVSCFQLNGKSVMANPVCGWPSVN